MFMDELETIDRKLQARTRLSTHKISALKERALRDGNDTFPNESGEDKVILG